MYSPRPSKEAKIQSIQAVELQTQTQHLITKMSDTNKTYSMRLCSTEAQRVPTRCIASELVKNKQEIFKISQCSKMSTDKLTSSYTVTRQCIPDTRSRHRKSWHQKLRTLQS